jgi:hypothetical protein
MKQRVTVNGTEYDSVVESSGWVICSSTKHDGVFTTTMEELQAQYGVKTAYFVRQALNERSLYGQ